MEAKKLKKAKSTINKGKVKKTIKNVICRPDAASWPDVSASQVDDIDEILKNYSVPIPNIVKPHWKEIKLLKKSERPRPPPIKKVAGLLFGISECYDAIQSIKVSAVIVESLISPQSIAQPVIDACMASDIPVVCVKNLRILCKNYFGIQTSCLGVKTGSLLELSNKIKEISQNYKPIIIVPKNQEPSESFVILENDMSMQVDEVNCNPYLYRPNKKSRVFVPSNTIETRDKNQFTGQQFIKISEPVDETVHKNYMRMIIKKITHNPNRIKLKEK